MRINRILIVGHGSIGKRHLRLARNFFPDADIRVLGHLKRTSMPEHSNGFFNNIDDLHNFVPQLAVIASPAPFHIEVALKLTEQGVHLLIEKPIATSVEKIPQLLELSKRNNTILLVGYNLRFMSSLQKFRESIHSQTIGKVLSVRCEIGQFLPSWRPNTDYKQCVSARSSLGGGALLELSHEIDYLRWIFGEIQWVSATLCKQSDLDIDVEDTAHLIFGFNSEEIDKRQLVASVTLDFIRHDTTRLCTAIGDKGSLRWDGVTGAIKQFDINKKTWIDIDHIHDEDSYVAEWSHFLKCIAGDENPITTGRDGLKVIEIIEAARQSSEDKAHVKVVHAM